MTGYKDENRPAFRKAAGILRSVGYLVLSPDELDYLIPVQEKTWQAYMRRDLGAMGEANQVYCLPGWRMSKGATLEVLIFNALGVPVFEFSADWSFRRLDPDSLPVPMHPSRVGGDV